MADENNIVKSIGIFLFRTIVILSAVAGVILLLGGTGSISIPYIEGGGGNQNPLVGISNALTFADNAVIHIVMLVVGGVFLLVSAIGIVIWRATHERRRIAAPIYAVAWVALIGFLVNDLQHPAPSIRGEVRSAFAELRDDRARYSVLYEDMDQQWAKYRKPHDPGPFTEFYKSGQKGAVGHYDLNGKMDGHWTRFQKNGLLEWEGTFADGHADGAHTMYSGNGKKQQDRIYRAGSIYVMTTGWYPDGQKKAEKARVANGDWESFSWHENGQTSFRQKHDESGRRVETYWYPNGQKKSEKIYEPNSGAVQSENWWASGGVEKTGPDDAIEL